MTPKAVKRRQKLEEQRQAEAIAAKGEQGSAIHYGAILVGAVDGEELWAHLEVDEARLILWMRRLAIEALPPGTRYEIRKGIPMHFGRSHSMAWYRANAMDAISDWADGGPGSGTGEVEATLAPEGGYYLIGRYTTPGAKH